MSTWRETTVYLPAFRSRIRTHTRKLGGGDRAVLLNALIRLAHATEAIARLNARFDR